MSKKLAFKKLIGWSDWDPILDKEQGTLTATASSRIKRYLSIKVQTFIYGLLIYLVYHLFNLSVFF